MSIKSQPIFCPAAAKLECDKMKEKLEETEGNNKLGALCLLVVFGSSVDSNDGDYYSLKPSCVKNLTEGKTVSKVLRIPK